MDFENLTPEQMEKAKACKTPEDILAFAREEGYSLSDAELETVSGGGFWDCSDNICVDYGEGLDNDPGWN